MNEWIQRARARGWGVPLRLALDALEPLGPLGAQLVWVLQPTLGPLVGHEALRDLARTLEDPEAVAALRAQLNEDDADDAAN